MMKWSLKRQITAMFAGLIIGILVIVLCLNVSFLEPYYVKNKEKEFLNLYEMISEMAKDDTLYQDETLMKIQYEAEKINVSFLVSDAENGRAFTNVHDMEALQSSLIAHLVQGTSSQDRVLSSTEEYVIYQTEDPINGTYYITMYGSVANGNIFLMRSPLESIRESVAISNRFLVLIGSIVVLLAIGSVWYFTNRLTKPILELTDLSNRMANLDFEAKYSSGGENEIGVLGANFNKMSERLEYTISELKTANNSLQKDIEQKEKIEAMRSELLGNVSHELKTPIALIQGYAEGLKEGINEDAEGREYYCDVIMDEAKKMNHLVQNLLTLNQLEYGNEAIAFERVNLTTMVCGVLQSMSLLIQQKKAQIYFDVKEPVYVWAEALSVELVISNYISNALNHLGGERVVEIKIQTDGEKARISVFNTGNPIPENDIHRIWDKFYKVDKAHTREYGGNGIGLSIVKAIMQSFRQEYGVNNYENGVEFFAEFDVQ